MPCSLIGWLVIKKVMGMRVDEDEELAGLDLAEMGMEAYPTAKDSVSRFDERLAPALALGSERA